MIAYEPGHDVEAQVVAKYFPGMKLVETQGRAHRRRRRGVRDLGLRAAGVGQRPTAPADLRPPDQ